MLWLTPSIIKKCERLHALGYPLKMEQGERVGRGYADLGAEEFVLIGERTLLSLFGGKTAPLPEGHEHFFFTIPSPDELVQDIVVRGGVIAELHSIEQREWSLKIDVDSGVTLSAKESTLHEVLLSGLIQLMEIQSDV